MAVLKLLSDAGTEVSADTAGKSGSISGSCRKQVCLKNGYWRRTEAFHPVLFSFTSSNSTYSPS